VKWVDKPGVALWNLAMRKVFNSLFITMLVAFFNSHLTFYMVMLSSHEYKLNVKQAKLLGVRLEFLYVFLTNDRFKD